MLCRSLRKMKIQRNHGLFYSAIKINKVPSHAQTWIELDVIMLREVSQTQKDKYHMLLITSEV